MSRVALKSSMWSTAFDLNDGDSVPMSPKSTLSPLSTWRFAISAARRNTASTSAPVKVVALATSSQNLRWVTRCRSVGRAINTFYPFFGPTLSFCSLIVKFKHFVIILLFYFCFCPVVFPLPWGFCLWL